MYNLVRVIKSFVATDGLVKLAIVSTHGLFYDIGRELITWACLGGTLPQRGLTLKQMRPCLQQLLRGSWDAVAYTKASDKNRSPSVPGSRCQEATCLASPRGSGEID